MPSLRQNSATMEWQMDLNQAIKAHTYWKLMLRWMINGERPVDPVATADDQRCELGQWIVGAGAAYGDLPEFVCLVGEHRNFHRIAGEVIALVTHGHRSAAEVMLAAEGEFSLASTRTLDAIRALQLRVESGSVG